MKKKFIFALCQVLALGSMLFSACSPSSSESDTSSSQSSSSSSNSSTSNGSSDITEKDPPKEETIKYTVSDFTALPENWELFEKSETAKTTTTYQDGIMQIVHSGSGSLTNYYGSLYRIATNLDFTDFTFEITLKMTDPVNSTRWLGIMYHTQMSGEYLTGYMANFRYNGNSASSAVSADPTTFDDDTATTATTKLSDGEYHTIRITMNGNTATHYIDNEEIKTWDVTTKDGVLGQTLTHGGFALIVNRSTVSVKSVKIENYTIEDTTLASTYRPTTGLSNAPTVVCDVTNEATFNQIVTAGAKGETGARPSNVILHLDDECRVTDENGKSFKTFEEAYTALNYKAIPVVYIQTEKAANAFIDFMQNTLNILDITVLSDDPALVKQVRTACPKIRGAVSYTEKTITNLYKDVVKPTTESYATIALLSQTVATQENVYYMQARFKTVWVQADGTGTADMYQCVNSGAYGIVSSDYASILSALASYPAHSYSRTIFNAAHRGLEGYNENSISGAQAAIAAGATHLELDGKLTTDGEIVLIHDADVERTTDGTGKVEEMSLSEVKNLNLDLYGEEKIPTLGEMIEAIRESDVVLILELKTTNANIVDKLKTVLDEYDFYDRIVVISFHEDLLAKMKTVLPEVATADLKVVKSSTFQSELGSFCARNTIFDNEWDCAWDSERERGWVFNEIFLRDRGIVGWYYTFDSIEDVDKVVKGGFVGITTNVADQYGDRVKFLSPAEQTETDTPAVGNEITLTATSYSGETTQVTGTIFYVEELDDCYAVIASAEVEADYILYTQIFYIAK